MSDAPRTQRQVRALFALVVVLGALGAAEIAGRVAYAVLDQARTGQIPRKAGLKWYEMPDPLHAGNWVLKPGVTMTLAETRALAKEDGLVLAVQALERGAARLGVRDDEVIFRIDSEGYKGPELDRTRSRPRVLAVGDSCTFGSLIDRYAWPRSAERTLAALGVPAEVVNAGVNGYSPRNAIARLVELVALEPDVAVIYIGWNALYGDRKTVAGASFALQRLFRTVRSLWLMRGKTGHDLALEAYHKPRHPDRDDPQLARMATYVPSFLPDVETLARGLMAGGARVWITTLPGLYEVDRPPSARALEWGHLPQWTDNPYVLAASVARYNEALRAMAPRIGVGLVDLDAWSRTALVPRDEYFIDSVHLTEEGQELIGAEVARAIAPALAPPR